MPAHIFEDGMKCPWFSLGSACSSGLSIYCIIKIQVIAHLHRVPESGVVYMTEMHIKRHLRAGHVPWRDSAQNGRCCACFRASSSDLEHTGHRSNRQRQLTQLMSPCVIKRPVTNDQLRRKTTQPMELPCPRNSRIFGHVSASAGSQVL